MAGRDVHGNHSDSICEGDEVYKKRRVRMKQFKITFIMLFIIDSVRRKNIEFIIL